jgi:hypothetical protein
MILSKSKLLLIIIIAIILAVIVGGAFQISTVDPQLWGRTIPISYAKEVFSTIYSWEQLESQYEMQSGAFSENKSKCNTSVGHFIEKYSSGNAQFKLIVGYLDELPFAEKNLIISGKEYKPHLMFKDIKTVKRIDNTYVLYIPWIIFNIRLLPKGKQLTIYGLKNSVRSKRQIGLNQAEIVEADFQKITLEVQPNKGLIRNVPKELRFFIPNHGIIVFLKTNKGKLAFLIYYAPGNIDASTFASKRDKFLISLETFNIIGNNKR